MNQVIKSDHHAHLNLGLEIVPNRHPTMILFLILLSWLVMLLNTILAITHARLPNGIELILGAIAKMHFIAESYVLCTIPLVAEISPA